MAKKRPPLPGWDEPELDETNYYVLECFRGAGDAAITSEPRLPPEIDNWMGGMRLRGDVPDPLIFQIAPDDEGTLIPFYNRLIPLMRNDLITELAACGVDNIDTYPAIIKEIGSGKEHTDFSAVNIIGTVKAADMTLSQAEGSGMSDDDLIDVFFEKLVLDESAIQGQLMFRLAESVSAIVVAKSVCDHLQAKGFDRLSFVHPGEWSG